MNKSVEQEKDSLEEFAVEIESPDRGIAAPAEITLFRTPDSGQYTQSTAEDASPARARRSEGPRTSRGKDKSKRNALTHGIFAKVMLLDGESREEFDTLLQGLRESLEPEGTAEEVLVEKLATLTWRYGRLLEAEKAEIQSERKFNSGPRARATRKGRSCYS